MGLATPSSQPSPELTDYSYRKIVIQKFPIPSPAAHGACLHTHPKQKGFGNTPRTEGFVAPWARGMQEGGGCTPLALSTPLALLPLFISIKNCSAVPPHACAPCLRPELAWGARCRGPRLCSPVLHPVHPHHLSCRLRLQPALGTLPPPLNTLGTWHARIHHQNMLSVQ